ncbi:hypothetical protein ACFYV5_19825 [Streptomyces sp. NPDC003035]|uniref:hypothetical protein n=1 Tax=Streptomyces sp. NPDC003035 TaxID=3364676 RepID=UPI0036A80442
MDPLRPGQDPARIGDHILLGDGDWTVVAYRADGDDRAEWRRFGCTGFHTPPSRP